MRFLLVAFAILIGITGPALAQTPAPSSSTTLTLDNLTPEQMKILAGKAAELKTQADREAAERAKAEAAKLLPPPSKVSDISEKTRNEFVQWSEIGTGIGKAVLATAKEIGVAAVDFANSGLGKLVIVLIIFKLFGSKLLGIAFATLVVSVMVPMGMRFIRPVSAVEYAMVPCLWGAFQYRRVVKRTAKPMDGDEITGRWFGGMVMIAVGLGIGALALFNT